MVVIRCDGGLKPSSNRPRREGGGDGRMTAASLACWKRQFLVSLSAEDAFSLTRGFKTNPLLRARVDVSAFTVNRTRDKAPDTVASVRNSFIKGYRHLQRSTACSRNVRCVPFEAPTKESNLRRTLRAPQLADTT